MIGTSEVKLGKLLGSTQPSKSFVNKKQRVPVFYCGIIVVLIIDTQAKTTIMLLTKQYRNNGKRLRMSDKFCFQISLDLSFQSPQAQRINKPIKRLIYIYQLDGMLIYSCGFIKLHCQIKRKNIDIICIFNQNLNKGFVQLQNSSLSRA